MLGGALACSDAGEDVPLAQLGQPVIHGSDDRLDVHAVADDGLRRLALESAVVLLPERALTRREHGRFDVLTSARDYLCPGERFREQGMERPSRLCTIGILGLMLVAVGSACSGDYEEPAIGLEEGVQPAAAETADETTLVTTPLESRDEPSDKAGCSTVKFCNDPDSGHSICVYSDRCDCVTSGNECVREVNAICGRDKFITIESDRC